jgi:hypothetical protein
MAEDEYQHILLETSYPFPREDLSYAIEEKLHTELLSYLIGPYSTSVEDTAQKVSRYVVNQETRGSRPILEIVTNFWTIIIRCSQALPPKHHAQTKLVDLVLSIAQIDTLINVTVDGRPRNVWKSMPAFAATVYETLRGKFLQLARALADE